MFVCVCLHVWVRAAVLLLGRSYLDAHVSSVCIGVEDLIFVGGMCTFMSVCVPVCVCVVCACLREEVATSIIPALVYCGNRGAARGV